MNRIAYINTPAAIEVHCALHLHEAAAFSTRSWTYTRQKKRANKTRNAATSSCATQWPNVPRSTFSTDGGSDAIRYQSETMCPYTPLACNLCTLSVVVFVVRSSSSFLSVPHTLFSIQSMLDAISLNAIHDENLLPRGQMDGLTSDERERSA